MILSTLAESNDTMSTFSQAHMVARPTHPWLRRIAVALVPGAKDPVTSQVAEGLLRSFRLMGHEVQSAPDDTTDVILTTARFGEPVGWREAPLFTARHRYKLSHAPAVFALVHLSTSEFQVVLDHFQAALAKEPPDPQDYVFPGLAPEAYRTLYEQGHRGGPILALERLIQAQTKSIRGVLLVGEGPSLRAYHLDLVGAHPSTPGDDVDFFYRDLVLRIVTTVSTVEVNQHQVVGETIPRALWQQLGTPQAMRLAAQQLEARKFFTEMVRIPDLVHVPAIGETIATQYSEGCFATWDPTLGALIATVTGSTRPVDKGNIAEDDLAVIVGVRPDGKGALVRHVEGKRNDPPSTEAVEMMGIDSALPKVAIPGLSVQAPVVRSKLHGHRGIAAYDPRWVEYVPLTPPYYHYLVSCGTEAQAWGIQEAFARAQALRDHQDPRQVVFTVLPGHGVFAVEKWVPDMVPFQMLWQYIDTGYLQVENRIPQGLMHYVPGPGNKMVLQTL